jgi:hypothetical protein
MTCNYCGYPNSAECLFPYYGVAPHICFYKMEGKKIGESTLLPTSSYPVDLTHTVLEFGGGRTKVVVRNDRRQVTASISRVSSLGAST